MIKKAALIIIWIWVSIFTLVVSVYSIMQFKSTNTQVVASDTITGGESRLNSYALLYSALPQSNGVISAQIEGADARSEILYQYLTARKSPLAPYVDTFVRESDVNGIDFRLPVAIAECESNLCEENKFPQDSYNCWGYGIHSKGTLHFASFEEGITKVIAGLKKFKDRGYMTSIEKLMELYTPPSIEKGGSWAKCVNHFMDLLQ